MKKINKIYSVLALAATLGLTSCIDETFPQESAATAGQIGESTSALEGSLNGVPQQMTEAFLAYGARVNDNDIAYPGLMVAQSEMLGDLFPVSNQIGYDWFVTYNTPRVSWGPSSDNSYVPWFTLYKFIKSANDIIATADINSENPTIRAYAGMAYACRAFDYLMLTQFYEPVENKYTDVSAVKGLTVPIVTEATTPDDAKNNPRVTHEEMIAFIQGDLDKAIEGLKDYSQTNHQLPSLAVAYGIKAKAYMWDQDFANAAKYARMAIDESGATPMTEDEWTNPTTGFNTACDSWMWYITYSPENMTNLSNFIGMISNEADWSYGPLALISINRSLYDKIGSTDFRKHVFLDPDKYDYYNYQTCRDRDYITEELPAYASLKFRCKGGDYQNFKVGGAADVPVMRVEEMYFIEAIAKAEAESVDAGKTLLNTFMQTYRDPKFSAKSTDKRDFVLEALDQMRIEFWGEGNAFPLAKLFKVGAMQWYEGSNVTSDYLKVNCEGIKPNWNIMIPQSEIQTNAALDGKNNPDPTQTVQVPAPLGKYGDKK